MNNKQVTEFEPNWHMLTAPYLGICFIGMIVILADLLKKLRQPNNTSNDVPSRFYNIVTSISIFSFILSSFIDFIDLLYYFLTGIDVIHSNGIWLIALTNSFYGISAVTLYMFVFGKLYFTLKSSAETYQLNVRVIYYIVIMISFIGLLIQFYAI
eukprot:UN08922